MKTFMQRCRARFQLFSFAAFFLHNENMEMTSSIRHRLSAFQYFSLSAFFFCAL